MKQIVLLLFIVLILCACKKIEPEIEPLEADRFEENDTQEDAAFILESLLHSALTISEEDDDWYGLDVSADSLSIICRFIHEEGDINLDIVDWKGDIRISAKSETDDEIISYNVDLSEADKIAHPLVGYDSIYVFKQYCIHVYTSSRDYQEYTLYWEDARSAQW